jgi:hypothetical protein
VTAEQIAILEGLARPDSYLAAYSPTAAAALADLLAEQPAPCTCPADAAPERDSPHAPLSCAAIQEEASACVGQLGAVMTCMVVWNGRRGSYDVLLPVPTPGAGEAVGVMIESFTDENEANARLWDRLEQTAARVRADLAADRAAVAAGLRAPAPRLVLHQDPAEDEPS